MGALQYVDVPGYAALILRRTFRDLSLPDAILDRLKSWLRSPTGDGWLPGVRWQAEEKTFYFQCPGGGESRIVFGFLEHEADVYLYQGATFQAVFFDELTQFTETQYRYLFSRLSRLLGSVVPLRMRAAGNPGGVGHQWVFDRLINPETREDGAVFVPAKLTDNPHVDQVSYRESLSRLDPVTRLQLEEGVWDAVEPGSYFDVSRIVVVEGGVLPAFLSVVRFWDLAGSAAPTTGKGRGPDYSASVKMGIAQDGSVWVLDVTEDRWPAGELASHLRNQAVADGRATVIRCEQEGGSSGLIAVDAFKTALLGFDFDGVRSTGSKQERAKPVSAACYGRLLSVIRTPTTKRYLNQLHQFPMAPHDDMVDATSGAFLYLVNQSIGVPIIHRGTRSVSRSLWGSARGPWG